jgi:putative oxidoreductase
MANGTVDPGKLIFPGVAKLYEKFSPYSYTIVRIGLGLILFPHGVNKLFFGDVVNATNTMAKLGLAAPGAWAWFIGAVEFFGGAMLIVGLFTRVAALAIFIEMVVISVGVLWPKWFWGGRGMEFVVLMGILALAIFFRGGGPHSLDRRMRKEF